MKATPLGFLTVSFYWDIAVICYYHCAIECITLVTKSLVG